MKCISYLALILILIGALNWGLWGFFQFDFVAWLTGSNINWLARVIYAVVGLAGLWGLRFLGCCCRKGGACKCNCSACNNCNKCCSTDKYNK